MRLKSAFVGSKHYDCHWNHSHVVVRDEVDGANTVLNLATNRLSELVKTRAIVVLLH